MTKKNEEISLNKISTTSKDLRKEMLEKMREIYPGLFGEGNILNAKELQALVDDYSKPEVERYAFPWTGKTESKRFAFTPSKARLVPDKDRSVDFDTTQNLIIEGENLEVLKLLQSSYFKKVKMIYIDPPYNTGHDFVYPDDYSESKQAYWEKGGVKQEGVRIDTNSESSGRYHSNWLSMMQSRLLLARNLLRDDGVIFVSIDDNEVHNLRKLMDEVFGEENFRNSLSVRRRVKSLNLQFADKGLQSMNVGFEYVLVYAKSSDFVFPVLRVEKEEVSETGKWNVFWSNADRPTMRYKLLGFVPQSGQWRWSKEKAEEAVINYQRYYDNYSQDLTLEDYWRQTGESLKFIRRIDGGEGKNGGVQYWVPPTNDSLRTSDWTDIEVSEIHKEFNIPFENPKSVKLIKALISTALKNNEIILDFFAGSGTTGQAVMQLNSEDGGNRKFILIQLPEVVDEKSDAFKVGFKTISQITIERVKHAGAKIKAEKPEVDTGFKTLRLTKSLLPQNMFEVEPGMTEEDKIKAWETYLAKSKQAHLFDFKPDELLVEIALKDGFDLNFKAKQMKEFKKNKILEVSDGEKTALVCLDESIQNETIKALEVFKERRFICLERSVDSTHKWSLKRLFSDKLWVV